MAKFEIKCVYLRKGSRKFFNDKEKRGYHNFLVENPEIMPDEVSIFKDKSKNPWQIWILDDLLKELGIDFENLLKKDEEWKFG